MYGGFARFCVENASVSALQTHRAKKSSPIINLKN
jgi:hypothetical protein